MLAGELSRIFVQRALILDRRPEAPYSPKCLEVRFSEVRVEAPAPWFTCEGSSPFETSQARADTVGLPGVASGNCAPCGIRSIGNPDAASILPVQLKSEMSAVAS